MVEAYSQPLVEDVFLKTERLRVLEASAMRASINVVVGAAAEEDNKSALALDCCMGLKK